MIRFECDYLEGARPEILEALVKTNMEQTAGYGTDEYCESARSRIRAACSSPDADVHFLVGGTQANLTVIASILRPWQAAVCADTGHIATHESGAIEATGHKVITVPGVNGKIKAEQIENLMEAHLSDATWEHVPQPGMVYISQPTEYGTLYSRSELEEISAVCRRYSLKLFVDGARLIYSLACPENDVTLADLARLTDVFYIGGTKAGALFGEAVVINNRECSDCFRCMIKQHGGLLAKGRLTGIQFDVLFTDELYMEISRHALSEADKIRNALIDLGVKFDVPSPTNQLFPILSNDIIRRLSAEFSFSAWGKIDGSNSVIRICTSWATQSENTEKLIAALKEALA